MVGQFRVRAAYKVLERSQNMSADPQVTSGIFSRFAGRRPVPLLAYENLAGHPPGQAFSSDLAVNRNFPTKMEVRRT